MRTGNALISEVANKKMKEKRNTKQIAKMILIKMDNKNILNNLRKQSETNLE